MPRVKENTITDKKIAEFFGTTTQTLRNWKNSRDISIMERYDAFREHFAKTLCSGEQRAHIKA